MRRKCVRLCHGSVRHQCERTRKCAYTSGCTAIGHESCLKIRPGVVIISCTMPFSLQPRLERWVVVHTAGEMRCRWLEEVIGDAPSPLSGATRGRRARIRLHYPQTKGLGRAAARRLAERRVLQHEQAWTGRMRSHEAVSNKRGIVTSARLPKRCCSAHHTGRGGKLWRSKRGGHGGY